MRFSFSSSSPIRTGIIWSLSGLVGRLAGGGAYGSVLTLFVKKIPPGWRLFVVEKPRNSWRSEDEPQAHAPPPVAVLGPEGHLGVGQGPAVHRETAADAAHGGRRRGAARGVPVIAAAQPQFLRGVRLGPERDLPQVPQRNPGLGEAHVSRNQRSPRHVDGGAEPDLPIQLNQAAGRGELRLEQVPARQSALAQAAWLRG